MLQRLGKQPLEGSACESEDTAIALSAVGMSRYFEPYVTMRRALLRHAWLAHRIECVHNKSAHGSYPSTLWGDDPAFWGEIMMKLLGGPSCNRIHDGQSVALLDVKVGGVTGLRAPLLRSQNERVWPSVSK